MLQLLQHLGNGRTELVNVPAPGPRSNNLLIGSRCSLVSAGTERMLVDFGKAGWLGKARRQPEKVRATWDKVRAEGALATWRAIRAKLAQPIPLGYCNVGVVVDDGEKPETGDLKPESENTIRVGDRVVSNGPHAEVVSVSTNLCARIPDGVSDEEATFTPLAAIALEGVDLLGVKPGDTVVVTGLGLIGQLAVRILLARGCQVLGLDPSAERRTLAASVGAKVGGGNTDPVTMALEWTEGRGVAGVLITASSSSNEIVNQSARGCRRRGKVVLVGVVGLQLNRADFYRNEVSFQVSNSYGLREGTGPGSVRANFSEVLDLMASGRLRVSDLITHRYGFAEAESAYATLGNPQALGILLRYGTTDRAGESLWTRTLPASDAAPVSAGVALIGAGNFAVRTLLPALTGIPGAPRVAAVASSQGVAAWLAARQFGAARATTDLNEVFSAPDVTAVFLTTRHDAHAAQALAALHAGKHVWVEKPLCLTLSELDTIESALGSQLLAPDCRRPILMVGFNRRFSPLAVRLREALRTKTGGYRIMATINAGRLPLDHWTLDPARGGGRIVGEGCHWVDLMRFWAGAPITRIDCRRRDADGQDGGTFELEFANGVTGSLAYRTDLPAHVPKEWIEVSGPGWSARIENWVRLRSQGLGGVSGGPIWGGGQSKGHGEAIQAFLTSMTDREAPIALKEIAEVSRCAIAMQAMKNGDFVRFGEAGTQVE